MKIGFGGTVLASGLKMEKMDGIGIYSRELWKEFQKSSHAFWPLIFPRRNNIDTGKDTLWGGENPYFHKWPYTLHVGFSSIFNRSFDGFSDFEPEIDLFFAPDHYIPFLKNTPVIATIMDIIPLLYPEWVSLRFRRQKNFAFKKAILSTSHIITISEYSKNDLCTHLGIKKNRISVIPPGVSREYFQMLDDDRKKKVLEKYGIKKDFFVFVGTLQFRKNISRIIKAFGHLPLNIKKQHELIIIGQDGWGTEKLKAELGLMEDAGYGKWIQYIPDKDLIALLQSARALVYPSLYEGFGLPVVEAFASRCPVISSGTTAIPEVAGDAAILIDPCSVAEISDAMELMTMNESERKKMISLGYRRAQQFTWEKSAEEHIKIFEMVLKKCG